MTAIGLDSLQTRSTLTAGGKTVDYFSIKKAFGEIGRCVAVAVFDEGIARKPAAF